MAEATQVSQTQLTKAESTQVRPCGSRALKATQLSRHSAPPQAPGTPTPHSHHIATALCKTTVTLCIWEGENPLNATCAILFPQYEMSNGSKKETTSAM